MKRLSSLDLVMMIFVLVFLGAWWRTEILLLLCVPISSALYLILQAIAAFRSRKDCVPSPPKEISPTEYADKFRDPKKRKKALEVALSIRSFEIDLYWKRAIYFWTFIGLAFGAYFLYVQKSDNPSKEIVYAICCVGLTFTFVWYLVNRGSKFWTSNWESHVDFLEDPEMGPLYKTVLNREHFPFWNLQKAYPFSVGKLNQFLNLYICFIWLFLMASTAMRDCRDDLLILVLSSGTLFTLVACIVWGKTDFTGRTAFRFVERELKDGCAMWPESENQISESADEGQPDA